MRRETDARALLGLQIHVKRAEQAMRDAQASLLAMGLPGPGIAVSAIVRECWRMAAEAVALVHLEVRKAEAGNVVEIKNRRGGKH